MARRDFDEDVTISPPTEAVVPYELEGVKTEARITYVPESRTKTLYRTIKYRDADSGEEQTSDVSYRRETTTISVLAAANGTLCKSYLENGITPFLGAPSIIKSITETTYRIGRDGPQAEREIADEYISEMALAGSIGIQEYVIDDEPVVLTNALIHASRTITEYEVLEDQDITKTKTTRYLCWGLTQEGSQLAAAVASNATSAGEVLELVAAMTAFVCDGTRIQTVTGRGVGLQERPTEQDDARRRWSDLAGVDYADPVLIEESTFDFGIDDDDFDPFEDSGDEFDFPEDNWTFPTTDPPTDPITGDTWIDVSTDTPYVFDRFDWVPVLSDPPDDPVIGDKWFDPITSTTKYWDGTDWVSYQPQPDTFLPPPEDAGVVSNDPKTQSWSGWDGDQWVDYEATYPSGPAVGDTFILDLTGLQYTWDGDSWNESTGVSFSPKDGAPPSSPAIGDTWIDQDTNTLNYWDGDQWSRDRPEGAPLRSTAYLPKVFGVISTNPADGTSSVWNGTEWVPYLPSPPPSPSIGDLRIDSANGEELRWNGTAWESTGNSWATKGFTPPADPVVGQQWIDDGDYRLKRWAGASGWQQFDPAPPFNPSPGEVWVDVEADLTYLWNGRYDWILYSEAAPSMVPAGGVYVQPSTGIEFGWDGAAWAPTGVVFGSSIQASIEPTETDLVRSVVVELPFPNDDVIAMDWVPAEGIPLPHGEEAIRPGYLQRNLVVPGKAREQAKALAGLEHALRYGTTYGANVTMPVWRLPAKPLAPFYVRAGGLEVQYLADGASWQWDGQQLVVSCDGILCGATGRVEGEPLRPWVSTMVRPSSLPTVDGVTAGIAAPANTIPTPLGFRPARPGNIWSMLPTSGSDVFEEYRTPSYLYMPFSPVERERIVTFLTVQERETEYSLLPVDEGAEDVIVMITIDDTEVV